MRSTRSPRRPSALLDALSFSQDVRGLVEALQRERVAPRRRDPGLVSHPFGFVREVASRRLTIAEYYRSLASTPGPEGWQDRLAALRTLVFLAWHAKTLSMPLNTARVQVALMKTCLGQADDRRAQLERMSDFALASYGSVPVIRRLLGELGLVEVPETGRTLAEMDLGWDDHVHDALTEGHKTPSQLVLDAFIRGISRLTVVYYDLEDPRIHREVLQAAEILGIRAEVGVEFSVGPRLDRVNFLYIPAGADRAEDLEAGLAAHAGDLASFHAGLQVNAERRQAVIHDVLNRFNEAGLRELNASYADHPFLQVPLLRWPDLEAMLQGGRPSRIHLGALLWERILPILHKRVLYHKNQLRAAEDVAGHGRASWEVDRLRERYQAVRRAYETCTPSSLQERYLPSSHQVDYDSAFPDLGTVLEPLSRCGGRIVFIHPLSRGLERATSVLVEGSAWITDLEVFNMADAAVRDPEDLRLLATFTGHLQAGRSEKAARLLSDAGLPLPEGLEAACRAHAGRLAARCGTDYVGRKERVPGMGFLRVHRGDPILARSRFLARHARLPDAVAARFAPPDDGTFTGVCALSPPVQARTNRVGDEHDRARIPPIRAWRYLHPTLKSAAKALVGFVTASLVLGPAYGFLWLAITGSRNILVDLVASAGGAVRAWRWKAVDRDNLANSLFWTGFSVPILAAVQYGFDAGWPHIGVRSGVWEAVCRFCCIALANGLYIHTHNRLRGFDRTVARANFFRTVMSWPLATAGSFGLDLLAVPAIVQAKFWSDVVAGVVEGLGKSRQRRRLSQRTYQELFRSLLKGDPLARLAARTDILFVWALRPGGRQALRTLLTARTPPPAVLAAPDAKIEEIRQAREALDREFADAGSLAALTGLVLQHYDGSDAVVLSERLATWHDAFVRFLRRLPAGSPTMRA
ncbi:MAG: hypothetical protein JXB39_02860 [Deltaproteobacteria bacterium]|nr:hypothetical protein [Deltaproteobacteria bacterium]